ncbi:MAG: hypothetical protein OZ913_03465, partial [Ignavibacteriaceae bacterium]|nr:hypothetical protein [Ignavibacteriaceae bacterium]
MSEVKAGFKARFFYFNILGIYFRILVILKGLHLVLRHLSPLNYYGISFNSLYNLMCSRTTFKLLPVIDFIA